MRLELTDPTHSATEPGRLWTQTNINEATPEVLSPLCWTFWGKPTDLVTKKTYYDFGLVPRSFVRETDDPNRMLLASFYGRQAINVDLVREVLAKAPGMSPDAFERDTLGYVRVDAPPVEQTRKQYPAIALRMPKAMAVQGRRLQKLHDDMVGWWQRDVFGGGSTDPRALLLESRSRFEKAMHIHLYSRTGVLPMVQIQLGTLAAEIGRPELVMRLFGGFGKTAETEIAEDLWAMSRNRVDRQEFLRRHGFHGPSEGNPIARVWRERPESVDALAEAYAGRPDGEAPTVRAKEAAAQHRSAEVEFLAALPRTKRPSARWMLRTMGTQVNRLSLGKAAFLMAIDGCRAAARAMGADLVERGLAGDADDCFYLTFEELTGPHPDNFAEVVAFRREKREEYKKLRLPTVWTGRPEAQPADDLDVDRAVPTVTGSAGSPGVAEGRVRIVDDPADGELLEPGEVLVCRFTDPSWSAMFTLAEAVVIDLGGLTSHGAVVSREMGLPCVIGTGNGSRVLRTGDLVRVDGSTGTVEILERA